MQFLAAYLCVQFNTFLLILTILFKVWFFHKKKYFNDFCCIVYVQEGVTSLLLFVAVLTFCIGSTKF